MWRNSKDRFGTITKSFHWVMAFLILAMFGMGRYMTGLPPSRDLIYYYGLHKSFGILLIALIVMRIFWRKSNPTPKPLGDDARANRLAEIMHRILYLLMVLVPLLGWAGSSASGLGASFFNLLNMPNIAPENETLELILFRIHEIAATLLVILALAHAGAALYRHFIKRDDTLRRMTIR
ncbi:cytochrome b [Amylibacter ulvae]|uniref:Cytochrome b n=1 Tax=Paramylibacter ulvae TaxID=1651968 RepID=A0ABQ3D1Q9_9RHOB|nr:cytochrome b [Amylibacter ulvae]GHA54195.1 cytochrome b [Amylibacter ulvae]